MLELAEITNDENYTTFQDKVSRLKTRSHNTLRTYTTALKSYCRFLEQTPSQILEAVRDNDTHLFTTIDKFISHLAKNEKSSKTIHAYIAGILKFFRYNFIKIDNEILKNVVSLPTPEARLQDRIPTLEELNRCFNVTNLRGRTLLSHLVSSGCRLGESTKIRVKDIHFEEIITWIQLQKEYTKGHKERIVFVSPQCSELLQRYIALKNRGENDRVFPIGVNEAWFVITEIFDDAGILVKDQYGRNIIHPHCTRKYFKTMCVMTGVPDSLTAKLMGHTQYLDASYLRTNMKMLSEAYQKVLPHLTITETVADLKEMQNLQHIIRDQESVIKTLSSRLDEMGGKVEQVTEMFLRYQKLVEKKEE